MNLIDKVVIKNGVDADTVKTINLNTGQVDEINAILATISTDRGVASYNVNSGNPQFVWSGVGDNEMWIYIDGIGLKINGITSNATGPQGIQGVQGPQGIQGPIGGIYPSMGALSTQTLWWELDYSLDTLDLESNGKNLFIEVDGFAGDTLTPFRLVGLYTQINGGWDFMKTTIMVKTGQVSLTPAFLTKNTTKKIFLRLFSNESNIRAICRAYRETAASTHKMEDAVVGFQNTAPTDLLSTELLFVEYIYL